MRTIILILVFMFLIYYVVVESQTMEIKVVTLEKNEMVYKTTQTVWHFDRLAAYLNNRYQEITEGVKKLFEWLKP